MLLFKKKFLSAILAGEKTQTLRKRSNMRAGQRSYIPGAGYIRIDSVERVALAALTDADAVPDGFPDASALLAELRKLYGDKLPECLYRIRFHLLPPEEQEKLRDTRAAKKSKSPPEIAQAANSGEVRISKKPLSLHPLPVSPPDGLLTVDETAAALLNRCMVHRNVCDWKHEPGRTQDFFSIFLKSPRDVRGIPTVDGYTLLAKIRAITEDAQWEEVRWIVTEVCQAWSEWQYAVERFYG